VEPYVFTLSFAVHMHKCNFVFFAERGSPRHIKFQLYTFRVLKVIATDEMNGLCYVHCCAHSKQTGKPHAAMCTEPRDD
jgi:hypothetical protein